MPTDVDPNILLAHLNDLVPSIKLKLEVEVDGKLPFLDTLIIKSNNGFKFKVYRKPTHVDAYIHYFSYHHDSVKKSVFSGMFLRALRVCDPEHIDDEINHINQIAKKLCYPNEYINNCWMQARKTFYQIGDQQPFNLRNILSLPYHHELKPITRILKSLNINVVFKYESVIKNVLIRNSPVMVNNPGVYYIPCNECPHPEGERILKVHTLLGQDMSIHKTGIKRTLNKQKKKTHLCSFAVLDKHYMNICSHTYSTQTFSRQ